MTPQQRYYQKNKENILAKAREKYAENIEIERQRSKEYKRKNSELIRLKRNQAMKSKRAKDPCFKLRANISRLIRKALKKSKTTKSRLSFLNFVNYSMEELKTHLESMFETWMNWNNWGVYCPQTWDDSNPCTWTWQIDHIIPQSSLLYTSMEDANFKKCWALTNLRPLSSKENFLKGSRNAVLTE